MTSVKLGSGMSAVRRHLRVCVAAWLVLQAAALSSIVPRDCCAAHRPASAKRVACHEAAPVAADVHAHHSGAAPGRDTCSMRGACGGPMAAFLAQLSLHGVLAERPTLVLHVSGVNVARVVSEHLISRLSAPDSPPPRA